MSTPQCPKCKAALTDDYGMVTCPSCGTVVFIDMDGMAHIGEETRQKPSDARLTVTKTAEEAEPARIGDMLDAEDMAAPTPAFEPEPAPEPEVATPILPIEPTYAGDGFLSPPDEEPAHEPIVSTPPAPEDFAPIAFDLGSPPEPETPAAAPAVEPEYAEMAPLGDFGSTETPAPTPVEEPPASHETPSHLQPEPGLANEDGELNMDVILGFAPAPDAPAEAPVPDFGPPGDPLGLNGYANSEISQGQDGYLLFKILISGIDSKEMRQSIREVIEDSRFAWDPAELMGRVSKGILQIDNVPPVKAVILINRIKRLPVQIRWEQSDIRQMDAE